MIFNLILGYEVYIKYRKNPRSTFEQKYFREIPDNYSPEIFSYLLNKKISKKALSAEILNLISKKIIIVKKISKKNYELTINQDLNKNINSIENRVIKLIFGSEDKVKTKNLCREARLFYDYSISNWDLYYEVSKKEAKKRKFYENDEIFNKKSKSSTRCQLLSYIYIYIFILMLIFACPPFIFVFLIYLIYKLAKKLLSSIKKIIENYKSFDKMRLKFLIVLIINCFICFNKIFKILSIQYFYRSSIYLYLYLYILFL